MKTIKQTYNNRQGEYEKEFDKILNAKSLDCSGKKIRGVCSRCGNVQSHSLIYCYCGKKFTRYQGLTVLDCFKIAHNREWQNKPPRTLRPEYYASIYYGKSADKNKRKAFIEYLVKECDV